MSATIDNPHTGPPPRRKSSVVEDGGDSCRICRGEGSLDQPLFFPCKCSGSIKYVHQDCLMEWLSHSNKKHCELCKTPFRFTKLYDQSMPDTVPIPLFLRQICVHGVKAVGQWLRYALVIFVWLCWLPWMIRQVWRGLFWLADGSWVEADHVDHVRRTWNAINNHPDINATTSNVTALPALNATNPTFLHLQHNNLNLQNILWKIPLILNPLSAARYLLSTFLGPLLYAMTDSSFSLSVHFGDSSRSPSILTNVETLSNMTRHASLNHALMDIMEGQLICLLVIAAFILVFLIREWVINHQPVQQQNAEPAQREVAVPQGQPARPVQPRRRNRIFRDDAHARPRLVDDPNNVHARPRARPRLRRVATENNILLHNNHIEPVRPIPPQRAASLLPNHVAQTSDEATDIESWETFNEEPISMSSPREPPPLTRGAFDEVSSIRRTIEESSIPNNSMDIVHTPGVPGTDGESQGNRTITSHEQESSGLSAVPQFNAPSDSSSLVSTLQDVKMPGPDSEIVQAPVEIPTEVELHGGSVILDNQESKVVSSPTSDPYVHPTEPSNSSIKVTTASEQGLAGATSVCDFDDYTSPSVSDSDDVLHATDLPDATEPAVVREIDATAVDTVIDHVNGEEDAVEPETRWHKLCGWLWQNDDYVVEHDTAQAEVPAVAMQEIVHDLEEQAPFVPIDAAVQQENEAAIPPNIPEAGDVVPNDPLNDANAIDDAEDLEGIMELIGVEGPIAGMFQNVCFSVFLITLTLAASIWIPYVWGKICLLFMANPISVFIRAPLYLLSRIADMVIDVGLYIIGMSAYLLNHLTKIVKIVTKPFWPAFARFLDTQMLEQKSRMLFHSSGGRLQKTFSSMFHLGLRPDLPTFSMQSHHALRVFETKSLQLAVGVAALLVNCFNFLTQSIGLLEGIKGMITSVRNIASLPTLVHSIFFVVRSWFSTLSDDLKPISFAKPEDIDYSLMQWTAKEKIFCIVMGYCLFASVGFVYLKAAHYMLGLRSDEDVDGIVADTLRQAGGILKVVVIIGIEMIVFPLYCGTMLDIALLPLFKNASVASRCSFFLSSPMTSIFVHWFAGTCYMFHFALFVSMCRKLFRRGVLYFIRDPDDPTFHPVRDVLEKPVLTQLGKIGSSAVIYGGLLIFCLGGIIAGLNWQGSILPIRWRNPYPRMAVPVDVVFFNFVLPFILRKTELTKRISNMYSWWLRSCARGLRISFFLFGEMEVDEQKPGMFLWSSFWQSLFRSRQDAKVTLLIDEPNTTTQQVVVRNLTAGHLTPDIMDALVADMQAVLGKELATDKKSITYKFASSKAAKLFRKQFKSRSNPILTSPSIVFRLDELEPVEDGTYVRAPNKDSVRIPKGTDVFLPVTHKNRPIGDKPDHEDSLHNKKDGRFEIIYVPPNFRARILTLIALLGLFVAVTGVTFTVGPLLTGRALIRRIFETSEEANDFYAFTFGFCSCALLGYVFYLVVAKGHQNLTKIKAQGTHEVIPKVIAEVKYLLGLSYLMTTFGIVLPFILSLVAELYIHVPVYTYLLAHSKSVDASDALTTGASHTMENSESTIPLLYVFQSWTLGLLYLRIIIRLMTTYPNTHTQVATAVRGIVRDGLLRPDVRLATRAFILPVLTCGIISIIVPTLLSRGFLAMFGQSLSSEQRLIVYRYSFPCILISTLAVGAAMTMRQRLVSWRIRIRDEVYLIGERLHNFHDEAVTVAPNKSASNSSPPLRRELEGHEEETLIAEEHEAPPQIYPANQDG